MPTGFTRADKEIAEVDAAELQPIAVEPFGWAWQVQALGFVDGDGGLSESVMKGSLHALVALHGEEDPAIE